MSTKPKDLDLGKGYRYGWHDELSSVNEPKRGLSAEVVEEISRLKGEPEWMTKFRLKAYRHFLNRPMPTWGGDLSQIDFDNIYYYIKPIAEQVKSWDDLPEDIKNTYVKLGIPEAEREFLGGVTAQYECLRGSTLVWTTRGMRPIKELEPGDEVFSLDDASTGFVRARVVGMAQSGEKEVFEVRAGGRVIGASANHPFLVLRDGQHRWIAVKSLRIGDQVAVASDVDELVHATRRELVTIGARAAESLSTQASEVLVGYKSVEEITPFGTEATYDIEVAGQHNFVAEGFVVHNSEVVYHQVRKDLEEKGVFFSDMDTALREHPDIVKEHFGKTIPPNDNKFAALNSAVWSGGSFIYVPPGVHVEIPLQAYFRINKENMGQFERTLIIVDEGAYVHYVEGCSAPIYTTDSLHSAVVEIVVKKGARCRYTTIQNWSPNVYNLVTKRAVAHEGAVMEWVDGNIGCLAQGSRVTTRGGVKPIEDVIPGEEILSFDHDAGTLTWSRVKAKKFSGNQQVREVRIGERRLFVTDNHPFSSYTYDAEAPKKRGRYALAYVRADRLREAIVPVSSLDYGEPWKLKMPELTSSFESRNQYTDAFTASRERPRRLTPYAETTDDLMWLFGAFLGDGSIDHKRAANGGPRWAKVTFSVPRDDRARERLMRVMSEVMEGVAPTDRRDGVAVTWNSVELAGFFEENGFVTGALAKRLPGWVLDLPESQRLNLVAGYLDADGCAPVGKRGFSVKSVNRDLLTDVAEVITSLGITSRIYTEHEGRDVKILGYDSRSRGAHRLDFACDPRLVKIVSERLAAAALSQTPPALAYFRKVGRSDIELPETVEIRKAEVGEPGPVVPTWDIEVDGTGNFVSEGFIVHNSKLTMKYPSIYLMGEGARGEVLSVAFAGAGQHQDAGGKIICAAPNTTGQIISKSVSAQGGRTSYRGLVRVEPDAKAAKTFVRCDALILDEDSRSDTYPYMEIEEETAATGHEATVSKVGDEQLFYLMSRGIPEAEAMGMIVNGFIEPITKELPMEYAIELTRLIQLQMEGAVG